MPWFYYYSKLGLRKWKQSLILWISLLMMGLIMLYYSRHLESASLSVLASGKDLRDLTHRNRLLESENKALQQQLAQSQQQALQGKHSYSV